MDRSDCMRENIALLEHRISITGREDPRQKQYAEMLSNERDKLEEECPTSTVS